VSPSHLRWDDALEDRLERTLDYLRRRIAARRAVGLLSDKSYLRGHTCHCPPTLAVHYVHSEGIREGADVVMDFGSNIGSPGRRQLPIDTLAAVAGEIGGEIVHVKTDLLPAFLEHVLPRLGGPIVLVTGDSDIAPVSQYRQLLDHPLILHWFAQNCDLPERHPRLTRIPIGLDNPRYSKLDKRIGFFLAMAVGRLPLDWTFSRNDMGEQDKLNGVLAEGGFEFAVKPPRALCTFHMNQRFRPNIEGIPERVNALRVLQTNPSCHFVARRLSQIECWRIHRGFAFEVSPRGKGLDCFRTWEALALGTIPILKSSSLDPLFQDEDLPVVIVESWEEITAENLRRWQQERRHHFTDNLTRKLTNAYWLEKIRQASKSASETGVQ
jgi:hypothetical protein